MARTVSNFMTRRSVVAGLALTAAPLTVLARADKANAQSKPAAPEKSLYERLGGVFAIAAVVDHFSDAVVKNPIVGQKSKNPRLANGTPRTWEGCPASSSCERFGFATFRVDPSIIRPPSPARRRSDLRRPTEASKSPPQNSMRSQRNSVGPWTSSRSRSARRTKSWQPSPPTKLRSPPATLLSAAEAFGVASLNDPAQPNLGGGLFAARRRGDRMNGRMSTYGP